MKMGEIRARPDGSFEMMTPRGVEPVTLRCTTTGVVEVEEVSNQRSLNIEALTSVISQPLPLAQSRVVAEAQRQANERRAW
jgi:hypothetical protein